MVVVAEATGHVTDEGSHRTRGPSQTSQETETWPLGPLFSSIAGESSSLAGPVGPPHKPAPLPLVSGSACGLTALEMHRWGMEVLSQAATVPGYSLGLQCSHSASAPTRSHLTRQLGSWSKRAASRSRDQPVARIALPHRPFARGHTSTYTLVPQYKCARVARKHGGHAPYSRPGAEALFWKPSPPRPRLSHAHWIAGWPLHPCLFKSLTPPTTIFFLGPHNFISSFQCSQCLRVGRSSFADSTSLERPTPPATGPGACCPSMLGQAQTAYASRPIPPFCYYCQYRACACCCRCPFFFFRAVTAAWFAWSLAMS